MSQGTKRLGVIIRERRLIKEFFDTEEFQMILREFQIDLDSQHGNIVWIALSVAGRASSVSKPAESVFLPLIRQRLSRKLPEWISLENGEDRYYLARALQYAPNELIVDHAFAELAREEAAEKARGVWARVAFEHSDSLEEYLVRINKGITQTKQDQKLSPDSIIRRVRRINSAILENITTSEKPIGPEFGDALNKFYAGHTSAGGPDDRDLREESANEFAQSVVEIIRLNYRAKFDPSIYGVLVALRNWWKPTSPPKTFEAISKHAADFGIDAVHFSVQRGQRDKLLRDAITRACGKRVVGMLSKSIADNDVSLPEDIAYWFVHGSEQVKQKSTAAIEALSDRSIDEYVGHLLIHVSSADVNYRTLKFAADQIGVIMPEEANTLLRAADRLSQIVQLSRAISRARNIELFAEHGQIVSFDPAVHVAHEDCVFGSDVVVTTPGAIRKLPDRPHVLIVKVEVRKR